MSVDSCFEVSERDRAMYIDTKIVAKLPKDIRALAKDRATVIVDGYIGRDADALSILAYATERGRFGEFAQKLEKHLRENMGFIDPGVRRLAEIAVVRLSELFFLQCYEELGINPRR